jgi:hypothetical protein
MSVVVVYCNANNEVYVRQRQNSYQLSVQCTKQAISSPHFVYKNAVLSAFIQSDNVRIVETIAAKDFDDAEEIKQQKIEEYNEKNFLIVNQKETALTSSFYRAMVEIDAVIEKFKNATKIDNRSADVAFTDKKLRAKLKIDYLRVKANYQQALITARKFLTVNEMELRFFNVA